MARIANVYLPAPATVVTLPHARTPVVLTQAVTATRGGTTVAGTVTTAGAKPVCTFVSAVGPGRVRVST